MGSANERRRNKITSSVISWAYAQNDRYTNHPRAFITRKILCAVNIIASSAKMCLNLLTPKSYNYEFSTVAADGLTCQQHKLGDDEAWVCVYKERGSAPEGLSNA